MLRYAITDRRLLAGNLDADEQQVVYALAAQAKRWAAAGVDWVQLREKDLPAGRLEQIARAMAAALEEASGSSNGKRTRLLVNGRADVALAAGAAGVHLTAQTCELTVAQVRAVWPRKLGREAVVSVSCHMLEEIVRARESGADLAVFGPVFEKPVSGGLALAGVGLERLREACRVAGSMPVLALGGVTAENAAECIAAGAAGVAGIRLFLGDELRV